jgi:(p)ppGpp synthase/HD superfamily hydrolase
MALGNPMTGEDQSARVARLLTRAFRFAAERHAHQRRKGQAGEPYVNHLAEVADLVAEATGGCDPELVAAALLHDVVEDTPTTLEEIAAGFGANVAGLVAEATDDKTLPKAERKRLQIVHAAGHSRRAKILKLADKTSNLRALAVSPPADWPSGRRLDYVDWGRAVVAGLRGASPWLERCFDDAAQAADAALGR